MRMTLLAYESGLAKIGDAPIIHHVPTKDKDRTAKTRRAPRRRRLLQMEELTILISLLMGL
jgi:hypothetical protein